MFRLCAILINLSQCVHTVHLSCTKLSSLHCIWFGFICGKIFFCGWLKPQVTPLVRNR